MLAFLVRSRLHFQWILPRIFVWTFWLAGAGLARFVSGVFAVISVAIMLLCVVCSHPRIRFKRSPAASPLVVAFGQGVLGFCAGATVAVRDVLPRPTVDLVLGGIAATLFMTGLHPLTQVYQVDEGRARGDRTFAARLSPRVVFVTTTGCLALALGAALPAACRVLRPIETIVVALGLGLAIVVPVPWAWRYDPTALLANHDRLFTIGLCTSGGYVAPIVPHLLERLP